MHARGQLPRLLRSCRPGWGGCRRCTARCRLCCTTPLHHLPHDLVLGVQAGLPVAQRVALCQAAVAEVVGEVCRVGQVGPPGPMYDDKTKAPLLGLQRCHAPGACIHSLSRMHPAVPGQQAGWQQQRPGLPAPVLGRGPAHLPHRSRTWPAPARTPCPQRGRRRRGRKRRCLQGGVAVAKRGGGGDWGSLGGGDVGAGGSRTGRVCPPPPPPSPSGGASQVTPLHTSEH